jgi:hypothetical protein
MAVLGLTSGFQRWEMALMLAVFASYSMWTIMAALRETDQAPTPAAPTPWAMTQPANRAPWVGS